MAVAQRTQICQTFLFPEQSVMTQSRDKTVKQSSIVCLSSSILKSGITLDCIATQWLTFFSVSKDLLLSLFSTIATVLHHAFY